MPNRPAISLSGTAYSSAASPSADARRKRGRSRRCSERRPGQRRRVATENRQRAAMALREGFHDLAEAIRNRAATTKVRMPARPAIGHGHEAQGPGGGGQDRIDRRAPGVGHEGEAAQDPRRSRVRDAAAAGPWRRKPSRPASCPPPQGTAPSRRTAMAASRRLRWGGSKGSGIARHEPGRHVPPAGIESNRRAHREAHEQERPEGGPALQPTGGIREHGLHHPESREAGLAPRRARDQLRIPALCSNRARGEAGAARSLTSVRSCSAWTRRGAA
jgi:hypothetical protein